MTSVLCTVYGARVYLNCVKSKIRLIEKKCFQFINLEKCVKYDIAKIYVFLPQNPNF